MHYNSKPLVIRTRIQDAPLDIAAIDKLSREIEEHLLAAHHLISNSTKYPGAVERAEQHRILARHNQDVRDRALAMRN